jgi:hypothetical protein
MKEEFFLITPNVDGKVQPDELVSGNPMKRVRQILGGGWEWTSGDLKDGHVMGAFRGDRKVMVLRFPEPITREQAEAALRQIEAGL